MARTAAAAQVDGRLWSLSFENGPTGRLRVGGFYAGHETKEELKDELRRQFWEQDASYLMRLGYSPEAKPSADSQTDTSAVSVKAAGRRKVRRGQEVEEEVRPADNREGEHIEAMPSLPVSHSTRSAERRSKLAAAEKRKSAAAERRRFLAAQKKRKLADDRKLNAVGVRKTVTRSSHS